MKPWIIPEKLWHPEELPQVRERLKNPEFRKAKYDVVKKLKPKVIVEIGVRAGYSAYVMLKASPKARYIGYDNSSYNNGKKWISNLPRILSGWDYGLFDINTQHIDGILPADFYHIDGDHTEEGVYHDLEICWKYLQPGGHMLVDDIGYINPVRIGVRKWMSDHAWEIEFEEIDSYRGDILIWKDN